MAAPSKAPAFAFFRSSDINLPFKARISLLTGCIPVYRGAHSNTEDSGVSVRPADLSVTCSLCADGEVLGLPSQTRPREADLDGCEWQEWLQYYIKYRDLPHTTVLAVTVWGVSEGKPLQPLGGATMRLFSKQGRLKTGVHRLRLWEGQEADLTWPSATPGKEPVQKRGEVGRLDQLLKRYERGELHAVYWLDPLAFKKIELLRHQELQKSSRHKLIVTLELPSFPHAVLYNQTIVGPRHAGAIEDPSSPSASLLPLYDPEVGRENPSELKAQKLARSVTRGLVDRDLKPDVEEKRQIDAILLYPPDRPLNVEERALMWRFRYSLTSEARALTKFLKCVDWADAQEARQAADLMQAWAPIAIADALELLSPDFSNEQVRGHAVEVLQRTEDEELLYYLLQLVQALRYESTTHSRLSTFLVARATNNTVMATLLHWYLYTELSDPSFGDRASAILGRLREADPGSEAMAALALQGQMMAQLSYIVDQLKSVRGGAARKTERLRDMVSEAGQCGELMSLQVPLPLDPTVLLNGIIPASCSVFKSAMAPIRLTFRVAGLGNQHGVEVGSSYAAAALPGAPQGSATPISTANQVPAVEVRRAVIYKKGDDLRQDQLVVQMISLMDRLLKREALDLRLTPYKVLATSSTDGLIELIPSMALEKILHDSPFRSINKYLAHYHPDPAGPFGLKAEVVDTFVKSSAGYCVMTYILGVGDRHLDNLMLAPDGRLFHIDFGYILGRDPKAFPPPMKLCAPMVEAMGGSDSPYYRHFRTYCCEAYNILRKSATLILSLFHLMAGAAIPDVRHDPEKAMLKLQEKLRLDMSDEDAVEWMQQLLNDSATALMPQITDRTHRWATYWLR